MADASSYQSINYDHIIRDNWNIIPGDASSAGRLTEYSNMHKRTHEMAFDNSSAGLSVSHLLLLDTVTNPSDTGLTHQPEVEPNSSNTEVAVGTGTISEEVPSLILEKTVEIGRLRSQLENLRQEYIHVVRENEELKTKLAASEQEKNTIQSKVALNNEETVLRLKNVIQHAVLFSILSTIAESQSTSNPLEFIQTTSQYDKFKLISRSIGINYDFPPTYQEFYSQVDLSWLVGVQGMLEITRGEAYRHIHLWAYTTFQFSSFVFSRDQRSDPDAVESYFSGFLMCRDAYKKIKNFQLTLYFKAEVAQAWNYLIELKITLETLQEIESNQGLLDALELAVTPVIASDVIA
jgi:hypothetical protein